MAKAKKPKADKTVAANEPGRPEGSTSEVIAQRDTELWRGYTRGLLPSTLALTYGLTEDRVKVILRQQRNRVKAHNRHDPAEIVDDYLFGLDAMIDELAAVSSQNEGSARVGAITGSSGPP